jgi:hypothetical protein
MSIGSFSVVETKFCPTIFGFFGASPFAKRNKCKRRSVVRMRYISSASNKKHVPYGKEKTTLKVREGHIEGVNNSTVGTIQVFI